VVFATPTRFPCASYTSVHSDTGHLHDNEQVSEDGPFWRTPSNQEWAEAKAWAREFTAKRRELERLALREWINQVKGRLGLVSIGEDPGEREYATYEEAAIAARAFEDAYAANLPHRAQEIADRLSEMLPDGMRFEWRPATREEWKP
jgi:hypothetical protein